MLTVQPFNSLGRSSDDDRSLDDEALWGTDPYKPGLIEALVRCAVAAYEPQSTVESLGSGHGASVQWFAARSSFVDTRAFGLVLDHDLVVAFRGTKELRDWLTDLMAKQALFRDFDRSIRAAERVHTGFQLALDAIWSSDAPAFDEAQHPAGMTPLKDYLETHASSRRVWFAGHSLGGALATVAAARLRTATDTRLASSFCGLVTIGSPRVFERNTARKVEERLTRERIFRVRRSLDLVTGVPYGPTSMCPARGGVSSTGTPNLELESQHSRRSSTR